jgi:hypothetical protein
MPKKKKKKIEPTSAIEGWSIQDVRKYLDVIRKTLMDDEMEFQSTSVALPGYAMSIEEFCFRFIRGSYTKRKK